MLSYAFRVLRQKQYEDHIKGEAFDNIQDLFAEIIFLGVSGQLKQGLYREYICQPTELHTLHGKLNLPGTFRHRIRNDRQILVCEPDDLSEDNILNQIIKTTMLNLVHDSRVQSQRRDQLRSILRFFKSVHTIHLSGIKWNTFQFQRHNQTYEMLINICRFIYTETLLSRQSGNRKTRHFSDENMARLYEKFILEYYKREFPQFSVSAKAIKWHLDKNFPGPILKFLPAMQSDITIQHHGHTLIIDAKYYTHMMQQQFDKYTLNSGNLYQIFTYVKNEDKYHTGKVSGLLLYAKSNADDIPVNDNILADFSVDGNRLSARTLDLNQDFNLIKQQLNDIATEYFNQPQDIKLKVSTYEFET